MTTLAPRRLLAVSWTLIGLATPSGAVAAQRFEVTVAPSVHIGPLTGRLIVAVSRRDQPTYGRPMKGHSWHVEPWAAFVKRIAAAVRANAPAGENAAAWNY